VRARESNPRQQPRRIVVPVGGTDREFLAQEQAVEIASMMGVSVAAVHVSPDPDQAPPDLFHYLQQQGERWGVEIATIPLVGSDVADALIDELGALDLVVIGTGRMGTRYHFGSVAEQVLRRAPCPLLVVRLDGAADAPRTPDAAMLPE
jgi:nucleotide-binding universal stress UspA family protein